MVAGFDSVRGSCSALGCDFTTGFASVRVLDSGLASGFDSGLDSVLRSVRVLLSARAVLSLRGLAADFGSVRVLVKRSEADALVSTTLELLNSPGL